MINLSILICHLPNRRLEIARLMAMLNPQLTPEVEVKIDAGEGHTGLKRNRLIESANGQYISFVDDDDLVSYNYIDLVTNAIIHSPDCVGMVGILRKKGQPDWTFRHSITVTRWCKDKTNRVYFRTPNHLNPVKREHACRTMFNSGLTWGEDKDYSDRLRVHLNTERFIEEPIYIYLAR